MATPGQGFPPYGRMVESDGAPTPEWYSYFLSLHSATGGGSGIIVSGANFDPQAPDTFLAGPSSGGNAKPTFRAILTGDLAGVAGQVPGTPNGNPPGAGVVGEFISNSATGVVLTSGVTADITSLLITPGDWDVWANFATSPVGGASQTLIKAWINIVSATDPGLPNGGAYLERGITTGEAAGQAESVGMMRLLTAAGAQVFLSAAVTYAGGTLGGTGFLGARRRR